MGHAVKLEWQDAMQAQAVGHDSPGFRRELHVAHVVVRWAAQQQMFQVFFHALVAAGA